MTNSPVRLRPKAAAARLGIALSTLWAWSAKRADFPKSIRLSGRCTVFDAAELDAWVKSQS
ncbi:MAG: AlpA family phage regulatory protein [Rhodoferax sp.]|nr:AlpA family phage regulatory protein [Rhodoferax sp.]MCF8211114.1 AlpA family phage regulatory protein [Rhodoferax sp.]